MRRIRDRYRTMKKGIPAFLILAFAFASAIAAPRGDKPGARRWYSGSVISVSLTGYGSAPNDPKHKGKNDTWWTYCVSGEGQTHTAVSRTSPTKADLTVDSPIKFSTDKDRLYILNRRDERYTLRRLSLDGESVCR